MEFFNSIILFSLVNFAVEDISSNTAFSFANHDKIKKHKKYSQDSKALFEFHLKGIVF